MEIAVWGFVLEDVEVGWVAVRRIKTRFEV